MAVCAPGSDAPDWEFSSMLKVLELSSDTGRTKATKHRLDRARDLLRGGAEPRARQGRRGRLGAHLPERRGGSAGGGQGQRAGGRAARGRRGAHHGQDEARAPPRPLACRCHSRDALRRAQRRPARRAPGEAREPALQDGRAPPCCLRRRLLLLLLRRRRRRCWSPPLLPPPPPLPPARLAGICLRACCRRPRRWWCTISASSLRTRFSETFALSSSPAAGARWPRPLSGCGPPSPVRGAPPKCSNGRRVAGGGGCRVCCLLCRCLGSKVTAADFAPKSKLN